ncbi:alpha/beta fold hydrolase [Trinickia fusca]|uniref:Alpha/beta fold hydrolase n=1 Tax=Trinickia fusca TaxID=2419777 RepID=A0A494X903_9BURK|nr:alpha/beta fold hydrolase [Trinickia fusca]RKP46940.1 alpha/beta fold hydrolase [Trinickia fusca]
MFVFPLNPRELFDERRIQFLRWGIPRSVIERVERRVTDNWREGPAGWTYEWSQEATAAAADKRWLLASMLYAAARFPVVCTPLRHEALRKQVDCFMRASTSFPVRFERIAVRAAANGTARFPVHVYRPKREGHYPLVCLTGGVDTGKMELHRLALALALYGRFTVVAMDMPGTGETDLPLQSDCDAVYHTVLSQLGGTARKAIVGVSFGGHWAAKLALRGDVDAAINWGGPIGAARMDASHASRLPNGMTGIIANATRLPGMPDIAGTERLLQMFSLKNQGLLDRTDCAPLLAVNGDCDPYIPSGDVQVFSRYPSAQVWLLRGLGHCAAEASIRVVPGMLAWLRLAMHGDSVSSRFASKLAQCILPPRVRGTTIHAG